MTAKADRNGNRQDTEEWLGPKDESGGPEGICPNSIKGYHMTPNLDVLVERLLLGANSIDIGPEASDLREAATTLTTLSDKNAKLVEAAKRALNFIENTESELGIKLESGDMLRQALAATNQESVSES